MRNARLFIALMVLLSTGAFAEDSAVVEELWKKLKAGDDSARTKLTELGPEARQLARRILAPGDPVHPKLDDESVEWGVLRAMDADGVAAFVEALETYRAEDRIMLIMQLRGLGPRSLPAADALLKIAQQETGELRLEALQALSEARAKPDYVIPESFRLSMLPDKSMKEWLPSQHVEFAWHQGVELLGKYPGSLSEEALVHVSRHHPSGSIRESAIDALAAHAGSDIRTVASVLMERLNDHESHSFGIGSSSVSERALYRLRYHNEVLPGENLHDLVQTLYRATYERNAEHLWRLDDLLDAICRCPLNDETKSLVREKLRPLLKPEAFIAGDDDHKRFVRVAAATVVLRCDPQDRDAAEFLIKTAGIPDVGALKGIFGVGGRLDDVRAAAVRGLTQGGKASAQWIPQIHRIMLREIKADPPTELAFESAWFIAQLVPDNQDCMNVLTRAKDEFLNRRFISWRQVEVVLGPRATQMLPKEDVEDFLLKPEEHKYEYDDWNWQALRAHQAQAVPAFFERLKSGSITQRIGALYGLGQMQVAAEQVIPELMVALKDPRATIRAAAAEALTKFGPTAKAALPALKALLKDEYLTVQFAVQEAIAAIAPPET